MSEILTQLGLYGLGSEIENSILAALTLGEPALLIGTQGTGKTEAVNMIASALREYSKKKHGLDKRDSWFSYQIYDASRFEYEDMLGIPNPKSMSEGTMDFIRTPTTVWGKKLVGYDEINRANPDRQSSLLEHIRTRTVQGIPTGTLWVFGMMNPYGDVGTGEMSDALVDRFLFYLTFPEFVTMPSGRKESIIERVGSSDARALKKLWTNKEDLNRVMKFDGSDDESINHFLASVGERLERLLKRAAELYPIVENELGSKVTSLVRMCFDAMASDMADNPEERTALLSGRRAGLVRRGLLAYRALEYAKCEIFKSELKPMSETLIAVMPICIPFGVSGRSKPEELSKWTTQLSANINSFWSVIDGDMDPSEVDLIYELFRSSSTARQLDIILTHGKSFDKHITSEIWSLLAAGASTSLTSILQIIRATDPDLIPETVILSLPPSSATKTKGTTQNVTLAPNVSEAKPEVDSLLQQWSKKPIIAHFVEDVLLKATSNENICNPFELRAELHNINNAAKRLDNLLTSICNKKEPSNTSKVPTLL